MELILLNPITYVAIILVVLQYRRQVEIERTLFGVRIHSMFHQSMRSIGYGLVAGIVATVLVLAMGITLQYTDFILVWGLTLFLMLIRFRYACIAYAGGVTALLSYGASFWPQGEEIPYLSWIWNALLHVNIPSLIGLIAILHIIEAILVQIHTASNATPVFIEGKRGKIVGAFEMRAIWFLPLLILAPGTNEFLFPMPDWWPLLGAVSGITYFTVPALIGFSDLAVTKNVNEKKKSSVFGLLLYSLILLGLAFLALYVPILAVLPAIFAVLGHEGISVIGRWRERNGLPRYMNDTRGLMIVSVLPGSAAAEMGLKPGEIVSKVNGIPVITKAELYEAIQKQSGAFCKLEVINLEGHVKFVTSAVYDGENHQLGIISAPEGIVDKYLKSEDISVIELFSDHKLKRKKRRRLTKPYPQQETTM